MRIQKDTYWEWVDGVCLSNLTTGQVWDASYWTRQDWREFCQHHEGNKWGQVENMTPLTGQWPDLVPVK